MQKKIKVYAHTHIWKALGVNPKYFVLLPIENEWKERNWKERKRKEFNVREEDPFNWIVIVKNIGTHVRVRTSKSNKRDICTHKGLFICS